MTSATVVIGVKTRLPRHRPGSARLVEHLAGPRPLSDDQHRHSGMPMGAPIGAFWWSALTSG